MTEQIVMTDPSVMAFEAQFYYWCLCNMLMSFLYVGCNSNYDVWETSPKNLHKQLPYAEEGCDLVSVCRVYWLHLCSSKYKKRKIETIQADLIFTYSLGCPHGFVHVLSHRQHLRLKTCKTAWAEIQIQNILTVNQRGWICVCILQSL